MSINVQLPDGTLKRVASMNGPDSQQATTQLDNELSLESTKILENKIISQNIEILQDNIFLLISTVQDLQSRINDLQSKV